MRTTDTPVGRCTCGALYECATHYGNAVPKPGDVMVCFECARPMRFDDKLHPQPFELDRLSPEERRQVQQVQAQIRAFRTTHPARTRS